MADPIFESIGDEAVELHVPLPGQPGAQEAYALATRLNTRRVLWGSEIAVNPDGSPLQVRGIFSADCARPSRREAIEVGIAAAPRHDWESPYISILFSLPRDTSVPEKYVTGTGDNSNPHIVELRLRGLWEQGHAFKIKARKLVNTNGENAYHVMIKDHQGALVSGHPWPLRAMNEDTNHFF